MCRTKLFPLQIKLSDKDMKKNFYRINQIQVFKINRFLPVVCIPSKIKALNYRRHDYILYSKYIKTITYS